uniref:Protein kinase domain-containing protein n=1 Tax=Angiostrongylus cantonensis TaxID=6313 RepID=A0A0K0DFC5_ANGCA
MLPEWLRQQETVHETTFNYAKDERLREMLYAPLNEAPIAVTAHSVVYRTFSHLYRGMVAIKIINKKGLPPAIADKFLPRELDITIKVRHPHLSRCLSVMTPSPTKIVIVSEFYEKGTLLELILKEKRIKEAPQGVRMFRQLMEAVHYLHERNIVHRDIKLENILLDANGDVKLADFGFARSRSFCGTRPYLAPQVTVYKPYDSYAADWYALGIVLYTMLIGKWPKVNSEVTCKYFSINSTNIGILKYTASMSIVTDIIHNVMREFEYLIICRIFISD